MAKKPIRDDSTFLGFSKINGVRVPFRDDNKPLDLAKLFGLHADVKNIPMCLAPQLKR